MPSTIAQLMAAGDLQRAGSVRWGNALPEQAGGVYVVSQTDSISSTEGALPIAPLDPAAIQRWLDARPELSIDGLRPTVTRLADRLAAFWLPDEVVLYIGKAASLSKRVSQYFTTALGARRPHAGGHFLKTLSVLDGLFVHYAVADNPADAEYAMLASFVASVSPIATEGLLDPEHPFPFANLEWPAGTRKRHGISGGREGKGSSATVRTVSAVAPEKVVRPVDSTDIRYRTQPVTAADIAAGQIRIPVSTPTKALLPNEKADLDLVMRGARAHVHWDPRVGPDRERSGVLRFRGDGKIVLSETVKPGEVLRISVEDGVVVLT